METNEEKPFVPFEAIKNPLYEFFIDSSSSHAVKYRVLTDGVDWSCSCPGYIYRGACRHITEAKNNLEKGIL